MTFALAWSNTYLLIDLLLWKRIKNEFENLEKMTRSNADERGRSGKRKQHNLLLQPSMLPRGEPTVSLTGTSNELSTSRKTVCCWILETRIWNESARVSSLELLLRSYIEKERSA